MASPEATSLMLALHYLDNVDIQSELCQACYRFSKISTVVELFWLDRIGETSKTVTPDWTFFFIPGGELFDPMGTFREANLEKNMANLKSNAVVGRGLMSEMCAHTRKKAFKPDLTHGIDCFMCIVLNSINFLLFFTIFVACYRYPPVMAARMDDNFYQHVRYLQRKTRCSNAVCKEFIQIT